MQKNKTNIAISLVFILHSNDWLVDRYLHSKIDGKISDLTNSSCFHEDVIRDRYGIPTLAHCTDR